MKKFLLAGAALAALAAAPAAAEGIADWTISPYSADISAFSLTVGGSAQGTISTALQPSALKPDKTAPSGAATLTAALQRDYDSGMAVALKTSFQLYSDHLAGDNYGNDFVQKVYGQIQTGLGNIEIGMNDGVAFTLALTGPVVDGETRLDNPNATFFRDPATKQALIKEFTLNSTVEPSYNYAKISYLTPKIYGVQLGVSYTPSEGKDVLPFVDGGPKAANRQDSIWEAAIRYDDSFGPFDVGLSLTAAAAHADEGMKTPGHKGLTEWAAGTVISYPVGEESKLSLGGAYRHSNAYGFDLDNVLDKGGTSSAHIGLKLDNGTWSIGAEYGDGTADGGTLAPTIGVRGFGAAAGYKLNDNLALTLGWQSLHYARDEGAFYNGAGRIHADAVYLHLHFQVGG
jgi:hypothetical protein